MTATSASTSLPKEVFVGGVALWQLLVAAVLLIAVRNGSWIGGVVAVLLASPVPIALLCQFYENGRVAEDRSIPYLLSHWQEQSKAFLIGDTFFLTLAAAGAALAWKHIPELQHTWASSGWWTAACAGFGLASAYVFRYVNDLPTYREAGAEGAMGAPSKLMHDGAFATLLGGLLCVGLPLLVRAFGSGFPFFHAFSVPYLWMVLLGLILWLVAGLLDGGVFIAAMKLEPANLHPTDWVWPER